MCGVCRSRSRAATAEPPSSSQPGIAAGAASTDGSVEEGEVMPGEVGNSSAVPGAHAGPQLDVVQRCHAALNLALFEMLSDGDFSTAGTTGCITDGDGRNGSSGGGSGGESGGNSGGAEISGGDQGAAALAAIDTALELAKGKSIRVCSSSSLAVKDWIP